MNFSPVENHRKAFKSITPSLRWDREVSLEAHKEVCKVKLEKLLGLDTFSFCDDKFEILKEEEVHGCKHIHFVVQTEENYFVNAHLMLPKNTTEKLPLCACLQGHVSGAHLSLAIEKFPCDEVYISHDVDFAFQAVSHGFAGLAIEQRGFGENGGNSENGATQCQHTAMGALIMGRTIIGERVWDIQRVIDSTLKHFGNLVTMEKSLLMGESGGGTATYYTACFDHRFELYLPIVALCTFEDSIVDISHCVCNYIPNIAKYFDMGDLAILIAPKKLLVFSTTEDEWFPLKGAKKAFEQVQKIYKAFGAQEKCKMLIHEGKHRFFADYAWGTITEMLKK